MKERVLLPLKDLRQRMVIRLTVAPKYLLTGAAKGDDRCRDALVNHLTWGLGITPDHDDGSQGTDVQSVDSRVRP